MRLRSGKVKMTSEEAELAAEVKDDGEVVGSGGEDGQLLVKAPVLLPEEMMAYIGKMLDFGSLKNLRQTDTSWSAAVTPQFQRQAVGTLSLMQTLPNLRRLVEETADLNGITAIKIDMMLPIIPINNPRSRNLEAEILPFKILVVNSRLKSLAHVLKTLEISGYCTDPFLLFSFFLSRPIQFQVLSKLVISNSYIKGSMGYRLFDSLYASAPNLSELVVDKLNPSVLSPLLNKNEEGSPSRNWSLVPNLASLTVTEKWSNNINALVNFPQNWASLDFKVFSAWGPRTNLELLMERNKDSFVKLKLIFPPSYHDISSLRLPESFSKLETLELELEVGMELGTLIYSTTFPALKALSLKVFSQRILGNFEMFWNTFFTPQVFRGLKTLKLDLGLHDHRLENLEWAYQMFPNAEVEIIRRDC